MFLKRGLLIFLSFSLLFFLLRLVRAEEKPQPFSFSSQFEDISQYPQYRENEVLVKLKKGIEPNFRFEKEKLPESSPKSFLQRLIDFFQKLLLGKRRTSEPPTLTLEPELGVLLVERLVSPRIYVPSIKFESFRPGERLLGLEELSRWYLLKISGVSVVEAVEILSQNEVIEIAQPNYNYYLSAATTPQNLPNDPKFADLWGMKKISAPEAWGITTGNSDILVAVLDTGIDYTHSDLGAHLWRNDKEIPNNNLDDDSNGWVDDYFGYDGWSGFKPCYLASGDPNCTTVHFHGSHTAGTIGAIGGNSQGVAGVNWKIKLLSVQVFDSSLFGVPIASTLSVTRGVVYSVTNGARVINMSLGQKKEPDTNLKEAVDFADRNNVLLVAAAGNDGKEQLSYPAAYPVVMAVAASTQSDIRAKFSNFGDELSVAAPGIDILSTVPLWGNPEGYMTADGTSMAAPHVAGLAALILSLNPQLTNTQVRRIIEGTADDLGWPGKDKEFGYGRINAYQAVLRAKSTLPTPTPTLIPTSTLAPTFTPVPPTSTPIISPTIFPTLPLVSPIPSRAISPTLTPIVSSSPTPTPGEGAACHSMSEVRITTLVGVDLGEVLPLGQDFLCKVTADVVNSTTACGLQIGNGWPLDICRYLPGQYGYQYWEGETVVFKCNTKCVEDPNCSLETLSLGSGYTLIGFDFSPGCGSYRSDVAKKSVRLE